MTTQTEVLKLALEALERYQVKRQDFERFADVITAIKEALAQPEVEDQEPVAWVVESEEYNAEGERPILREIDYYNQVIDQFPAGTKLYTIPPQRKPLTWEQKLKLVSKYQEDELNEYDLIEMVEAAHGIKE